MAICVHTNAELMANFTMKRVLFTVPFICIKKKSFFFLTANEIAKAVAANKWKSQEFMLFNLFISTENIKNKFTSKFSRHLVAIQVHGKACYVAYSISEIACKKNIAIYLDIVFYH